MKKLYNAGDTIVEVLIAMAVISSIVVVAYVTVNRATNNARQAQERGVATKLLETQAERLKAASPLALPSIFGSSGFCLNSTAQVTTSPCDLDEAGNPYTAGTGVKYTVDIVRTVNNFTITAVWASAGGRGNDQASLAYRIYP